MGIIENAGGLLALGDIVLPEISHFIAIFIDWLFGFIGNYGWTVVVFTLVLKLVLSPLDIWQKHVMHKNNRAMERMKPQIAKLQVQYANNKEMFQQKQLQLYKKEGYSMLGACLPTIVTLVVFFIVFAGFNSMTTYTIQKDFKEIHDTYYTAYDEVYEDRYNELIVSVDQGDPVAVQGVKDQAKADAQTAGDEAVLNNYEPNSFLWVKNVFVGDNWYSAIPSYEEFISSGLSGLRVSQNWVDANTYNECTSALRNNVKYQGWNGYLIMPILTVLITLGSQIFMRQPTPPSVDGSMDTQKSQGKMMKFMMPAMMGFFAVFYSSAFTIYLLVSQLFSLVFNLIFNLITDRRDRKEDEYNLTHTYK